MNRIMNNIMGVARARATEKYTEIFVNLYLDMNGKSSCRFMTANELEQARLPSTFVLPLLARLDEVDDKSIVMKQANIRSWKIERMYILNAFEKWINEEML